MRHYREVFYYDEPEGFITEVELDDNGGVISHTDPIECFSEGLTATYVSSIYNSKRHKPILIVDNKYYEAGSKEYFMIIFVKDAYQYMYSSVKDNLKDIIIDEKVNTDFIIATIRECSEKCDLWGVNICETLLSLSINTRIEYIIKLKEEMSYVEV